MKVSVVRLNCIILFSVVVVSSAQQRIDRATTIKAKKAIDNVVGGFVEEEERKFIWVLEVLSSLSSFICVSMSDTSSSTPL